MPDYQAPLADMKFVLRELFASERAQPLPGSDAFAADVQDAVLEAGARLAGEVLAPLNRSGDEIGCTFDAGEVRTPPGFVDAYARFAADGWVGLCADPRHGGQGAPQSLGVLIQEMFASANLSFSMYPGLSYGVCHAIDHWGSDVQRERYLPRLVDGSWSGTMCLTEPQCGTDLGLIRTRAEPNGVDVYAITGSKIFISAGEHDLTRNIVHLVLARLPDAPAGIKGISMFLVPKYLPGEGGEPGARNAVRCGGLEHKMGIRASATCQLHFDAATGFLVGEPHKGMRAMFTMMNAARVAVGVQGLALAEASYQGAAAHARERLQGRAPGHSAIPDAAEAPADPILAHPDVRRMLLEMRAGIEGSRALVGWVAHELDVAERHPDPARRAAAQDLVSLLTPVVKAFLTDVGSACTNLGVQVYGGHGYIRDNGMEQFVRDARICQIYEGTNGVQAMDLVARKLPAHTGRLLRRFFQPLDAYLRAHAGDEALAPFLAPLDKAFRRLQQATGIIAQRGQRDPSEAGAAASEYLCLFALVALGYLWCRAVQAAADGEVQSESFYRAKRHTAQFFFERVLPRSGALFAAIMGGAGAITQFRDEDF